MRLIDADKLIEYFYYGENDKAIINEAADRKIIDIIREQPTHNDRWIPCKKELPEESGIYVVTADNPLGEGVITTTFYYDAARKVFSLPNERWYDVKPIAWMREPEPYREEIEHE